MKKCGKCGVSKPLSEFYKRSDTKTISYQSRCKQCSKKWSADYHKTPKGKMVAIKATAAWRKKHPEYVYLENRKKRTITESRRLLSRLGTQRYRARKAQLPHTLTKQEWHEIIEGQNHRCKHCGGKKKLEQDHIIAVANGGGYVKENIQGLCRSCNASKGSRQCHL